MYIALPHTDSRFGDATVVGKLQKSIYRTRDAPQIWAEAVQSSLNSIGYKQSCFQPALYYHPTKSVISNVHVDDFLCTGDPADLDEIYEHLTQKFDLKKSVISFEDEREATYLIALYEFRKKAWKLLVTQSTASCFSQSGASPNSVRRSILRR